MRRSSAKQASAPGEEPELLVQKLLLAENLVEKLFRKAFLRAVYLNSKWLPRRLFYDSHFLAV